MARSSKMEPTWPDAQLIDAVAGSSNWRDVMRKLGLNASSAGAIRIVRRDVERLGLDTSHFRASASGPMHSFGARSWIHSPGMNCLAPWAWRQEAEMRGHGSRLMRFA